MEYLRESNDAVSLKTEECRRTRSQESWGIAGNVLSHRSQQRGNLKVRDADLDRLNPDEDERPNHRAGNLDLGLASVAMAVSVFVWSIAVHRRRHRVKVVIHVQQWIGAYHLR